MISSLLKAAGMGEKHLRNAPLYKDLLFTQDRARPWTKRRQVLKALEEKGIGRQKL
jgi:hypothetical protein